MKRKAKHIDSLMSGKTIKANNPNALKGTGGQYRFEALVVMRLKFQEQDELNFVKRTMHSR